MAFSDKLIRNSLAVGAGAGIGYTALNSSVGAAGGLHAITGALQVVGNAVHSVINLAPTGFAAVAAPFATAGAALYIANNALDMAGVENIIARRTLQAGSVIAGAASVFNPILVGAAASVGVGKFVWKGAKRLGGKISGSTT